MQKAWLTLSSICATCSRLRHYQSILFMTTCATFGDLRRMGIEAKMPLCRLSSPAKQLKQVYASTKTCQVFVFFCSLLQVLLLHSTTTPTECFAWCSRCISLLWAQKYRPVLSFELQPKKRSSFGRCQHIDMRATIFIHEQIQEMCPLHEKWALQLHNTHDNTSPPVTKSQHYTWTRYVDKPPIKKNPNQPLTVFRCILFQSTMHNTLLDKTISYFSNAGEASHMGVDEITDNDVSTKSVSASTESVESD